MGLFEVGQRCPQVLLFRLEEIRIEKPRAHHSMVTEFCCKYTIFMFKLSVSHVALHLDYWDTTTTHYDNFEDM